MNSVAHHTHSGPRTFWALNENSPTLALAHSAVQLVHPRPSELQPQPFQSDGTLNVERTTKNRQSLQTATQQFCPNNTGIIVPVHSVCYHLQVLIATYLQEVHVDTVCCMSDSSCLRQRQDGDGGTECLHRHRD